MSSFSKLNGYDVKDETSRANIGDLTSLDTEVKTDIVSAINEHETKINTANSNIGDLTSLNTEVKTDVVSAINEHETEINTTNSNIGDLTSLDTEVKTDVVSAINEVNNSINTKYKMVVIGDSYSSTQQSQGPLWYTYVAKFKNLEVYTNANDGQGFATGANNFTTQIETAYNDSTLDNNLVKEVYIVGGLNDIGNGSLTGGLSGSFATGVNNTLTKVEQRFPNANVIVAGILPFQMYNFYSGNSFLPAGRAKEFNNVLATICMNYKVKFINCEFTGLSSAGFFGNLNGSNQRHPSARGEKIIANRILGGSQNEGYSDRNTYLGDLPIGVTNGTNTTVEIAGYSATNLSLNINNYDNTKVLKIDMSGLPVDVITDNRNSYYPITDEVGHCNFVFNYYKQSGNTELVMLDNTGLNSGILYLSIPINLE